MNTPFPIRPSQLDRPERPNRLRDNGSFAFNLSIATIRTAQGKSNPEAFEAGTVQWQEAQVGVMRDTMRILDLARARTA